MPFVYESPDTFLYLIPRQKYRVIPVVAGILVATAQFDSLAVVLFVIAGITESARAILVAQKIHALFRVVSLYKVGVNAQFASTDLTAAAQKTLHFVLRNKTAFYRTNRRRRVKFRNRFIHVAHLFQNLNGSVNRMETQQVSVTRICADKLRQFRNNLCPLLWIFQRVRDLQRLFRKAAAPAQRRHRRQIPLRLFGKVTLEMPELFRQFPKFIPSRRVQFFLNGERSIPQELKRQFRRFAP